MQLFDSHAHYNDDKFDEDREKIIEEIHKSGVEKLIVAGYSLDSSISALEIAKQYEWIYTISGISPNDIPEAKVDLEKQLINLQDFIEKNLSKPLAHNEINSDKNTTENDNIKALKNNLKTKNKIVAIGEIGLDYYWEKDEERRKLQQIAFIKQINIANEFELPIVIHTREAVMDTLEILKKYPVAKRGVFHCCPLNRELVKEALKLGYYISFAGPITFKNSKNANEIIELVPLNRMLIETDSPYLAPEPKRGTRNDSQNVKYIAEKIASVKKMQATEIAKITFENACDLFNIE